MTSSSPRDRAEEAFGHLQQAASEMIAAAHDALGMVEEAVSTAGVQDLLDVVDHLSRSVFTWARTQGHGPPTASSAGDPGAEADAGDPGTDQSDPDPSSVPDAAPASNQATRPGRGRRPPPDDGPVERIPVR